MNSHVLAKTRCRFFILLILASVAACGGGGDGGAMAVPEAEDLEDIYPYRASGSYADILKRCALAETEADSCLVGDLPLLVGDAERPSVDDIMGRVLVSHDWMGLRFEQALRLMPEELLRLFSAVTTIIIDDDVRPSSYQAMTSTVFLDPAHLWLNNSEKAVIKKKSDYRSGYGDDLSFVSLARYVDGASRAWVSYSLNDNQQRSLVDIRLSFANLLLHELMHANDYFPPDSAPYLSPLETIYQAYRRLLSSRVSTRLQDAMPLQSIVMQGLGEVMYRGQRASSVQINLTATQVGAAMEADAASDDYAYASPREDAAMLFSEAMMKFLFDIDRDIGYAEKPADEAYCDDYIVAWGMRGRIADAEVKARAQFVVAAMYPDLDFSLFFQDLAPPTIMRVGESWCDNLLL